MTCYPSKTGPTHPNLIPSTQIQGYVDIILLFSNLPATIRKALLGNKTANARGVSKNQKPHYRPQIVGL